MKYLFRRPRIGLALGSGGAKGLAHIGVIKVLSQANIPIHCIAGSSIGAIVGALYAQKADISAVEKFACDTNWKELRPLIDVHGGSGGLLKGDRLEKFFQTLFANPDQNGMENIVRDDFSSLKIPLAVVATNMQSGQPHIFTSGSIAQALRASASVPIVFRPTVTTEGQLGDGGLSIPVPVRLARQLGADIVIAVDLDADTTKYNQAITSVFDVAQRVISLLSLHLAHEQVCGADIIIRPNVAKVGWSAFLTSKATQEVITIGEDAMQTEYSKLHRLYHHPFLHQLDRLFKTGY